MKSKYLATICLAISLGCLLGLMAGSLTSYAPTVSATTLQNLYLSRIFGLGGASLFFQALALAAVIKPAARPR